MRNEEQLCEERGLQDTRGAVDNERNANRRLDERRGRAPVLPKNSTK